MGKDVSDRVTVVKSDYDKTIEVRVIGEFVFDLHKEFRETYRQLITIE